ncbi:MAG: DUF11 domain-containing protein [Dokdonella sp.]|nr:DUF11 domain-containing protein [Dokdonella sp.]
MAPTTGVYGVYFSGASTGSPSTLARRAVDPPAVISANAVSAWDITVRSAADTRDDLDGRVFTFNWTMYLVSNGANFRLHNTIYIVTGDGYRYSQALRGIDPNRAAFYANSKGLIDAGNPLYHDFRGTNASATGLPSGGAGGGNITYQLPEYPIFFSDVDPSVAHNAEVNRVLGELAIPTVPAAPILLPTPAPTFVGNVSGNQSNINVGGTFTFSTQNTLTYEIVIRRGATGPGDTPPNCVSDYDPANPCNRVLTGTALTGSHAVLWDGRDNSGNPFPVGNFDAQIVGRNGEVHFPMADVEANFYGGPTLTKLNGNFAGGSPTTVYYDDRGYRAANGFLVGVLNGHLCGATSPISQPAPTHSLVGVDSADPNLAGPGKYYRWWTGTSDTNTDCAASANEFFGTAKTLDLWALEKTVEYYPEIEIIDAATGVDVGTAVAVSPLVLPGDTAYGTFTFYNAGDTTATGVTYGVTIGNPSLPATCPASVNITVPNPPPGITYTYNPVTCVVTLNNMPGSLAPGQTLGFSFNYVVAPANPGPIPVNTTISAGNETCVIVNDCAPNQAQAITNIAKPVINVSKSSVPAPGTNVLIGDTITYTLTVNISNAPLTGNLVLTDTLGPGLSFGSVTANPGSHFTPDVSNAPLLEFVLPTGKGIGTYTITYTAIVNSSAGTTVANQVTAIGGVDPSDPNPPQPTCGPCSLEHDVLRPTVTVSKASNPASGTAVSPGQTITYTVTVVVANAATNEDATITDTLSANQTFGSVTSSTGFTGCVGALTCTLPAGTPPGTYTLEYTATVNANATGTVGNNVVATNPPGGDPDPTCPTTCSTTHPLNPVVTLSKSANPASGTAVAAGQTITYTVSVNVANAALLSDVVVTDAIGAGLTFQSVSSSTGFINCPTGALTCTLPTGTAVGTYNLVYTATVDADATVSVSNSVTATGGNDPNDPANPQPSCTTPTGCETEHPLVANVTIVKSGPAESGGTSNGVAEPGETLTYTITLSNSGGVNFTNYGFVENVPNGATLTSVTGAGVTACVTPVVGVGTCNITVASVPADGSTTVTVVFQVADPIPAGVSAITNLITGGDIPPNCPSPNVCTVTTPTEGRVAIAKTVADANSNGIAEPGETLTWTITLTNDGGAAVTGYGLTDPLDPNTTFSSATNGGSHSAGTVTWTGLTVPAQGTLVLTVVTTVNNPIPDGVTVISNLVHETGGTPPDCSATPTPANCASIPTAANVTVAKSLSGESITADGIAEPGEQLTYTITLRNHGGTAAMNVIVNEIVPLHTVFVSGTPGWSCVAGSPAGTACDSVVNVPPADAGGSPGVTTLTFTVQVVNPLPAGVTEIANAVAIDDGTPPNCAVTPNDPACVVTPTINLNFVKSVESVTAIGPGTFWVAYRIDLANTGGSPVSYTLTDTPDFTPMGVTVTGNGIAATTNGVLNPALPGGAFTVVNGTAVQISANAVTLAVGASHSYTVRIPIAVSAGSLGNAVCTGAPGNGLYNSAAVTGSFVRDSNACAPVSGDQPLIRLVKSVRLGVDNNGDNYGNVGDVLHYTFVISNPGTMALSAIDLIDPRVTDLQCDATTAYGEPLRVLRGDELFLGVFEELLGGSLAPGDSIMCSATYTITAQDVMNRRVVNSATTHGASPDGQVVSSTSTAIYSNIR